MKWKEFLAFAVGIKKGVPPKKKRNRSEIKWNTHSKNQDDNGKSTRLKMYFLLSTRIFQCHVGFRGGPQWSRMTGGMKFWLISKNVWTTIDCEEDMTHKTCHFLKTHSRFTSWNLASRKSAGFLLKISRDFERIYFGSLILRHPFACCLSRLPFKDRFHAKHHCNPWGQHLNRRFHPRPRLGSDGLGCKRRQNHKCPSLSPPRVDDASRFRSSTNEEFLRRSDVFTEQMI